MMKVLPFNYLSGRDSFRRIRAHTWNLFLTHSHNVPSSPWQGLDPRPEFSTYELMNYTFTHSLDGIEDLQHWREDVKPNLPWADNHFEERVCGAPINPGVEWANWPWGTSADKFRDINGMFNHNYMERYWPKYAGKAAEPTKTADEFVRSHEQFLEDVGYDLREQGVRRGIRNEYGDLNDLVGQLVKNPLSRQEWFPIFHPEDVGEVVGGRKPCSLGYQFWVRGGRLHVYYPLRSCDFFHHMQDDIYLTIRLLLWVLNECRNRDNTAGYWGEMRPGTFTMHCTSLHVFANDMIAMKKEGMKS
jgi:thymidylate synthase